MVSSSLMVQTCTLRPASLASLARSLPAVVCKMAQNMLKPTLGCSRNSRAYGIELPMCYASRQ